MIVMMMPRIVIRMKIKEWGHGHNHGQQSQIAATGVYHDEGKDENKDYVFSKKKALSWWQNGALVNNDEDMKCLGINDGEDDEEMYEVPARQCNQIFAADQSVHMCNTSREALVALAMQQKSMHSQWDKMAPWHELSPCLSLQALNNSWM